MIFGKNRAFLYPTKVLADTNKINTDLYNMNTPLIYKKTKVHEL